jgi:hypothetical protein
MVITSALHAVKCKFDSCKDQEKLNTGKTII